VRRYGGKTAQERQLERRDRLIDAGIELFGTVGYHGTSIRSVLRESGLGERYFYENFESLEDLLIAVAVKTEGRVKAAVVEATAAIEEPTFDSVLRAGLTAIGEALSSDRRLPRIAIETIGVSATVSAARSHLLEDFVDLMIDVGDEFSDIPVARSQLLVLGLLGAANELLLRWASGQLEVGLPTVIEHIEIIFRGTFLLAAGGPLPPD
jgi:AcrR family transcriptional regulator